MRFFHSLHRLSLLAALLFAGGCVTKTPPKPQPPVPQPQAKKSYWQGDGVTGEPSISINLDEQRAHFFRDRTEVGQAVISSGKKGFETPAGEFKVIQRDQKHVSNLYGDFVDESGSVVRRNVDASKQRPPEGASFRGAKMPYFLRFNGGVGMHAGVVPNYRASHGCVRLPGFMAKHFFENAPIGTPVIVTGGPSAATIKKNQAERNAARPKPVKAPAEPGENPAKPAETPPPAPAPEPVEKPAEKPAEEPVRKPEPADAPAVPPGA